MQPRVFIRGCFQQALPQAARALVGPTFAEHDGTHAVPVVVATRGTRDASSAPMASG